MEFLDKKDDESNLMKRTTIVLPTLNEEENILPLIKKIKVLYPEAHIVVADDGSRDKTQIIVKKISQKDKNVKLLDRTNKKVKGITASVLDSLNYINTDFVIVMDSDMQHPPETVLEMVKSLESNDVVIATRRRIEFESFLRVMQSKIAVMLGRLKLMRNVKDPVSGFIGTRTELFRAIVNKNRQRFVLRGFKITLDLLKCLPRSAKVGEVYYDFQQRTKGTTKIGKKQIIYYLKSLMS